jgi:hypothetical protein
MFWRAVGIEGRGRHDEAARRGGDDAEVAVSVSG